MSDWAVYNKERFGHETIEEEWGFICFSFAPPFVALCDVWIRPELRRTGAALRAFGQLRQRVSERPDCTHFWAQVQVADSGSSRALRWNLALGFQVIEANNNRIILTREIGGSDGQQQSSK